MASAATIERLRHAVGLHAAVASTRRAPVPADVALERILGGEWRETAHGPAFVREEWLPLAHRHGATAVGDALDAPAGALDALLGRAAPHPARLAYFDIETTGLCGGTGTYVILAGVGTYEDAGDGTLAFRLRQYFLADVGGERAMLSLLAEDLAGADGVVTYNGRAFDLPVVRSRMTLARVEHPPADAAHFDLLHPARALFGPRLGSCRLADIERRILRLDRLDDIPGSLIPSLYFDYARAGRAAPLRAVLRHNANDVVSLTGALAALARLVDTAEPSPDDAPALAAWWERRGERERAAALLGAALPWLDGCDEWASAAWRYAMLCKRLRRREEAARAWAELWRRGDERSGIELAKHLEHHARDLPAAEKVTRVLLVRAEGDARIALERRLARLMRRRERRGAGPGGFAVAVTSGSR
jgi:uncharacterized protein